MKTITIREKQFPADYCGVGYMGRLKFQIRDSRPLSEIAPELENADIITVTDENGLTDTYEGYIRINRIEWVDSETVVVLLMKGDGNV